MNLISTLNAGVAAAANGWAEVYIRGTSTRATVFYDFEASTSDSSGDNIELDAYGAVEVYVNQLVDVVAKSPDGTVVRSWTDGYASPNIEVISPSFTGNDYVSGAAAVNEPTTLQAILNLWSTNAGAPDWKVDIGGTATTLEVALGATTGLVFNVKSPVYGAVGDGVVNDQAAIQAALAAAVAAGGGIVYFPAGTYLISSAIDWDRRVSIVGAGPAITSITTSSATNARIITWTSGAASTEQLLVSGLSFKSTVSNSGTQVLTTVQCNIVFDRCNFNASSTSVGIGVDIASLSSEVSFRNCIFKANGTTYTAVGNGGTTTTLKFHQCAFLTTAGAFGGALYRHSCQSVVTDCTFDLSSVSSAGTNYGIEATSATGLTVTGCQFKSNLQNFTACVSMVAGAVVTVDQCLFGNNTPYLLTGSVLASSSKLQFFGDVNIASSVAPVIPDAVLVAMMESTTTVPTWTMPEIFFPGQVLHVIVRNNSGGGWATMNFSGIVAVGGVTIPALTDTSSGYVMFIAADLTSPGTYGWQAVAAFS